MSSKKVPVSIEDDVVAIFGCNLKGKVHAGWIARVHKIDQVKFVTADRLDCRFAKFVDSNFKMLDYAINIRNTAVEVAMRADDPMQDDESAPLPKRPRKEMFDDIPKAIEIKVPRLGKPELTVKVLSCWYTRNKLVFELKVENIELFLENPPPSTRGNRGDMTAHIEQPNVIWIRSRHVAQCSYFCKDQKKWRFKTMKVEECGDEAFAVKTTAAVCQMYYNAHHVDPVDENVEGGENGVADANAEAFGEA